MVRSGVMGFMAEPADGVQMAAMQAEVVKAMDEGAIGVSTGLIYPPGSYASTEELIDVTHPSGQRNGFYFSHIRGEGETLLDAVSEAIRIGRESGAAVQISHFKATRRPNWDKSAAALELIDVARAEGLDVSADLYPYLASSTGLSSTLPQWAEEGGKEATLKRLADLEMRRRVAPEMLEKGRSWVQVYISRSPKNRAYEGRHVAELAAEANKAPIDWIFDALLEADLDIGMIAFGMSEDNRKLELRHPAMMIGTDGSARALEGPTAKGKPHPRNYGTFPRVLGYYVRELDVLSLEEAIWKMCGLPAQKLRWTDRGLLKEGYKADLVVLDPEIVADQATFQNPQQYPVGIRHVVVNGKLVIRDEAHTLARPGAVLGR
jgi:N-acyl-D-amino-acid deacylase